MAPFCGIIISTEHRIVVGLYSHAFNKSLLKKIRHTFRSWSALYTLYSYIGLRSLTYARYLSPARRWTVLERTRFAELYPDDQHRMSSTTSPFCQMNGVKLADILFLLLCVCVCLSVCALSLPLFNSACPSYKASAMSFMQPISLPKPSSNP